MAKVTIQDGLVERVKEFCSRLTDYYKSEYDVRGYTRSNPTIFTGEFGQRYVRIVQSTGNDRSVYCFVDVSNGDILKAAGWKAPAKGARGSIWNQDCDVGNDRPCNMFGGGLYAGR